MTKKQRKELAQRSAQWWADLVRDPKHIDYCLGDRRKFVEQKVYGIKDGRDDVFQCSLEEIIEGLLEKQGEARLYVEYHPCGYLKKAFEEAGIKYPSLPNRAEMKISENGIAVKNFKKNAWRTLV